MGKKNLQTHNFEIKNFKDVYDYCYLNGIMDINSFVEKCFKQGFDIEKYGLLADDSGKTDGEREKRVEIPVEVIKYVDKEIIKEVPVEKIVEVIKEVPVEKIVEKIVHIYDKTPSELEDKISHLEKELESERRNFSTKTLEMENIFENEISKKDKELDENKTKMLTDTLTKLRKEISEKNQLIENLKNKIKQLETIKINQGAVYLKDSNLTKNL
jgi:hypothetical protein